MHSFEVHSDQISQHDRPTPAIVFTVSIQDVINFLVVCWLPLLVVCLELGIYRQGQLHEVVLLVCSHDEIMHQIHVGLSHTGAGGSHFKFLIASHIETNRINAVNLDKILYFLCFGHNTLDN